MVGFHDSEQETLLYQLETIAEHIRNSLTEEEIWRWIKYTVKRGALLENTMKRVSILYFNRIV